MAEDATEEEMIHGMTMNEREALSEGLRRLPDVAPPREVWQRIRRQAEAEGLIEQPRSRRPSTWFTGGGIAAAVLLAAVLVPAAIDRHGGDPAFRTEPEGTPTNQSPVATLNALMVESRQLENDLRSLPQRPRVVRAGTAATISDLEDRIGAIDYQLNDPDIRMTAAEEEIFWRERVRLMKLLLQLRYAQAQRTAF